MDIKRTKHNFRFLRCCLLRYMIHPSSVRRRLLMTALPLGGLLVGLLKAIVRQMTLFTTSKTPIGGIRNTSLHGSVVGRALTLRLIPILLLRVLVDILGLVQGTLQDLIMCRELSRIPLTRWVPLLITLLETSTLTSVATRGLSLKPFSLSIHLLALVVHHNGAIHKRLEIGIGTGH
jgi:hypothetical protein